jgi:excisionase family DNA binding protein
MTAAAQLSRLYDRLTKAHSRDRTIQLSAEDLDWFVVSGAYARLLEAVAREAEKRSTARLEAKGYTLSPAKPADLAEPPASAAIERDQQDGSAAETRYIAEMPDVFSVASLAAFWGCSTGRVYSLIHGGELQSFKLGSLYRIRRDAVIAYQASEERPSGRPNRVPQARGHSAIDVEQALQRAQEMTRPASRPFQQRKPR